MPKLDLILSWSKDEPLDLIGLLYKLEKQVITVSLEDQRYSRTSTAKLLKLNRQTLIYKLKKFELSGNK